MIKCPDFSNAKIVVLGDAMLDRYWHGDTSRISPEAPVPVVKIEESEERVGGAANVAVNVSALGVSTTLISVIGQDEVGATLIHMLDEKGVKTDVIQSNTIKTTLKLRVLGRHQQLIRLDFEDKQSWPAATLLANLKKIIKKTDVLILSDYAKGVITEPQALIDFAKQSGVKVLVDPKNADLSVYRGATILTPNLGEFEATVGRCESGTDIENKGLALLDQLALEALLVTRGSQGMTLLQKNHAPIHIPAQAREVFDITGAGDTVIAVLGAALAAGCSMLEASQLANLAAGLAVGRLGTATITIQELQELIALPTQCSSTAKLLSLRELQSQIERRKARGERVVLTNGCFDILHAGHITYLQQARALGDCLIIAVNTDESVRRLKGKTRPINSLGNRLQVLAALGCVDYVVPFDEDTPEDLIVTLSPNVLVKGGDYQVEQIAGAKHVLNTGGAVEILTFVEGLSTTNLLEKMMQEEVI
jgi:D-beta-D-heptose 7-phosphate kinase / D-beta-D-heptose 1-phosphate adenosyltransferase